MERAAFYTAWREKKLRGIFLSGGWECRQRRDPRGIVYVLEGNLRVWGLSGY